MGAVVSHAVGIEAQGVIRDGKALGLGHCVLTVLDFCIVKFLHPAAIQAHQVVMVLPFIQLIDGLVAFKMAAAQNVGLFELSQHTVNCGQANIRAVLQQNPKDILGRQVPLRALLEYFQYFQPRQSRLESGAFKLVNIGHGGLSLAGRQTPTQLLPVQWHDHIATLHSMSDYQHRRAGLSLLLAMSASLVACGSLNGASHSIASVVTPYKMDIVQGNFVSKEQAAALQPGMSRDQVLDILGSPLLTSIFHAQRWDYVFTFKRQGLESQARKLTVFFKGEVLERIEADVLPTEAEFVASLDSGRKAGKIPVLEMTEEGLKNLPASAKNTETKPLPPLPASYPPLDPSAR